MSNYSLTEPLVEAHFLQAILHFFFGWNAFWRHHLRAKLHSSKSTSHERNMFPKTVNKSFAHRFPRTLIVIHIWIIALWWFKNLLGWSLHFLSFSLPRVTLSPVIQHFEILYPAMHMKLFHCLQATPIPSIRIYVIKAAVLESWKQSSEIMATFAKHHFEKVITD